MSSGYQFFQLHVCSIPGNPRSTFRRSSSPYLHNRFAARRRALDNFRFQKRPSCSLLHISENDMLARTIRSSTNRFPMVRNSHNSHIALHEDNTRMLSASRRPFCSCHHTPGNVRHTAVVLLGIIAIHLYWQYLSCYPILYVRKSSLFTD